MLQIAIYDRSAEHAEQLEALIRGFDDLSLYSVERHAHSRSFLMRLGEPRSLDIVFIDVTFGTDSGILLMRELQRSFPTVQFVFTSCYAEHAVDVAGLPHCGFLVKPYAAHRLHAVIDAALERKHEAEDNRILLPVRGNSELVLSRPKIIFFERMRRTTVVNCVDFNRETPLKLSDIEALCPPPQFVRPHNSYLVNLAYVKKIERFCLHLTSGDVLPISNQRRQIFRDALENYLMKK